MDSLARRLALSNVVDLAMQQKNGDVLVSSLRYLDLITKQWPLWVWCKGDSVVTGPTRTSAKTEPPQREFWRGCGFL